MEIVNEIEINSEEEQIDEQVEEQNTEQENIITIAKCAICEKELSVDQEMMKWLSDITFKRNQDARGARIQDALNFTEGNTCLENQQHTFLFDDKWFEDTNTIAITIKENNETLSKNLDNKHKLEEELKKIQKELQKIESENTEIYDNVPKLTKEFENITGTNKYKQWL